jgi:hypothetical protein
MNDLECPKNKKARIHYGFGLLHLFGEVIVELEGFEPSSREDDRVRSTCLVDIGCRVEQGHQHPQLHLSCCCLDPAAQHSQAQFCRSTPHMHLPQNRKDAR